MPPPNLLFIFSDQHSQHVSGCYGDTVVQTPNIDWIAREGVRFTNAYCPSPICVPSRMAMLTARWPYRQHCWTNDDFLRSDLPTWPMAVGIAGGRPMLVGRMHANGPDQLHGYADRLVGDHSPNWPGVPRNSMGVLEGTNDPNPESLIRSGAGGNPYQAKDKDATASAAHWLRTQAADRLRRGHPFCLTVGYMLPHAPYVVDREAFDTYANRVPPPRLAPPETLEHPFHHWWRNSRQIDKAGTDDIARARAAYWGLVHRLDESIGELLAALRDIGALENTLIVYASDHGDHLGERGLWWKHTFFEESVKVPLVMRLPDTLPAGETRHQVVNLIDLAQTMLEAIGAETLPGADGRSFWSVARDESAAWVNETFSEYCTDEIPHWTGGRSVQQRMLRTDRWKVIAYLDQPVQLFDLETDPDELNDLGQDPDFEAVREELLGRLLDGWDGESVRDTMRARRREKDMVALWARKTGPENQFVWDLTPSQSWLDMHPKH